MYTPPVIPGMAPPMIIPGMPAPILPGMAPPGKYHIYILPPLISMNFVACNIPF